MDIFTTRVQENCNGVHLMVDIETLGVRTTAPITSVGAVLFDPQATDTFEALYERAFLRIVDIDDAVKVCGPAEGGTLKWWFGQKDEAIKRMVSGDSISVKAALSDLWIYSHVRGDRNPAVATLPLPTHIWAKSPDFDCKILESACDRVQIKYPFFFAHQRCVRTAQDLAFPDGELPQFSTGVHHDARDDAVNQALMIQACYRALGLGRGGVSFHKQTIGRTG
jgi:hypothetical protein